MDSKDLILINDQTLNRIATILVRRRQTVAAAEIVTAGGGGITVYNLGQKTRHLHINPIHAEDCNCVSTQVAQKYFYISEILKELLRILSSKVK